VLDALAELRQEDRELVALFAWERLSYAQIAEALEVSVGTVRSRLARIRTRLRERVDEGRAETDRLGCPGGR
jgi:RNA polymerase sigma-70 factor (ECF subfamily)